MKKILERNIKLTLIIGMYWFSFYLIAYYLGQAYINFFLGMVFLSLTLLRRYQPIILGKIQIILFNKDYEQKPQKYELFITLLLFGILIYIGFDSIINGVNYKYNYFHLSLGGTIISILVCSLISVFNREKKS